jgi:hypothetical protein
MEEFDTPSTCCIWAVQIKTAKRIDMPAAQLHMNHHIKAIIGYYVVVFVFVITVVIVIILLLLIIVTSVVFV